VGQLQLELGKPELDKLEVVHIEVGILELAHIEVGILELDKLELAHIEVVHIEVGILELAHIEVVHIEVGILELDMLEYLVQLHKKPTLQKAYLVKKEKFYSSFLVVYILQITTDSIIYKI
jgi:hypothetical protein